MSDGTPKDEQKTERFNMFFSPSEMKAIDDWAWGSRIRSKSEAVRRLIQIGLTFDANADELSAAVVGMADAYKTAATEWANAMGKRLESDPPWLAEYVAASSALGQKMGEHVLQLYDILGGLEVHRAASKTEGVVAEALPATRADLGNIVEGLREFDKGRSDDSNKKAEDDER